ELVHLRRREVADTNRTDLARAAQGFERVGCLGERRLEVRPMHLAQIDHIRAEPAERRLDLAPDGRRSRVAVDHFVAPGEANVGGHPRALAKSALSEGLADDLLRTTEAVDRSGVDERDAALDG